ATTHPAVEYTPVSDAIRKAMTQSKAATIPRAYVFARPSMTAYQPRRKIANSKTGNAFRSDGSQNTRIKNSSRARFHAGCSGNSSRRVRYTKAKAHQTGTVNHVA